MVNNRTPPVPDKGGKFVDRLNELTRKWAAANAPLRAQQPKGAARAKALGWRVLQGGAT